MLNSVGKKLGVRIEFVDSVMDGRANGQYIKGKNLIQIAADSEKPYLTVAAHEITHRMQDLSPAAYRDFRKAALEYRMKQDGADTVTNLVQGRMDAAARDGVTLTQDEVMDEIAADFAGDMLDDIDLFERFAKNNRTVAQKLLDSLKEFIAKVKSIFTGKARDKAAQEAYGKSFGELEDVAQKWQTAFDAAEQQARNANTAAGEGSGARFSLKQTNDGKDYVMVENAMTNAQLNDRQAIADYIAQHIGEVYTIIESGQRVYIGDDLPAEYTRSRYTQSIIKSQKSKAKNKAVSNLGEMIEIATNRRWEQTKHAHNKDAAYGMYRYDTTFAFPVQGTKQAYKAYDAELVIRNASDGKKYLYDIVAIKENTGLALDLNKKADRRQNAATQSGASTGSISTDGENVNGKFQLRSAAEVEQEIRDLKRERTVLASRNKALEQRVQMLKGEMRISKEPSVVLRDVKKLGLNTIRQYGSDVKYADIQSDMEALGKAVMKKDVSMADLMPYAKNAAKTIVENTSELTEYGAELLDIRDYLKQQHIRFNGDMAYYEDFRKSHMGTLKLSKTNAGKRVRGKGRAARR